MVLQIHFLIYNNHVDTSEMLQKEQGGSYLEIFEQE